MLTFRVLFICTANYCRSPMAERLMIAHSTRRFGQSDGWRVVSAGTDVRSTLPMHPYSVQVLNERGVFTDGHLSRMVDAAMLTDTDVILTAAREHRAFVVRMLPGAIGRTFTIRQFARLAAAVQPIESDDAGELGRRLVREAKAARGLLQPVPVEDDDLPDPIGGPVEGFAACASALEQAVGTILDPLRLTNASQKSENVY